MGAFLTFPPDITWADAVFDGMMTSRAAIYRQDPIATTSYGLPQYAFTLLTQDIPCLVQTLRGEELNTPPAPRSETSTGITQFKIFMRPLQVDSPAVDLGIRHFLQILSAKQITDGKLYPDPNDANSGRVLYNITDVQNPACQDHHIEVYATVLTP